MAPAFPIWNLLLGTVTAVLAGIVIVPLGLAVAGARGSRGPALSAAGALGGLLWLLHANLINVASPWGRMAHAAILVALLICALAVMFIIDKSGIRVPLKRAGRLWFMAAAGLLAIELLGRTVPIRTTYDLNPGVKFFWPDWVYFQPNHLGFRDREFSREKRPGVFRVLLLGDSYTEGAGLARDQTFGRHVEALVNARLADSGIANRVEVVNIGRCGYNTREEWEELRKVGDEIRPDLIVLNYVLNDAETHPLEIPFVATPDWALRTHDAFLKKAGSYAYYYLFTTVTLFPRNFETLAEFWRHHHREDGKGWADVAASLGAISEWASARRSGVLAVIWPTFRFDRYPEDLRQIHRQVRDELGRHRIPTLDLLPSYETSGRKLPDFGFGKHDRHPNADAALLGARVIAKEVLKFVPADGT